MNISGEAAATYRVVRLDTFETANKGPLVSADDATGTVVWKDATGAERRIELGSHAIRILPA